MSSINKLNCLHIYPNCLPITHTPEELDKVLRIILESFESSRMNVPNMTKNRLIEYLRSDLSSRISTLPRDLIRYYLHTMVKQTQEVGVIATIEPIESNDSTLELSDAEGKPLIKGDGLILKNDGSFVIGSYVGQSGFILFFSNEGKQVNQVDVVRKVVDPYFAMDNDGDLIVSTMDKLVRFKDGKPFMMEGFRSSDIINISHAFGQIHFVDRKEVLLINEKLNVISSFKAPENFIFLVSPVGFGKKYMAALLVNDSYVQKVGIYSFEEKEWTTFKNFENLIRKLTPTIFTF